MVPAAFSWRCSGSAHMKGESVTIKLCSSGLLFEEVCIFSCWEAYNKTQLGIELSLPLQEYRGFLNQCLI